MTTLIRCVDFETTGQPSDDDPHAVCETGFSDVLVSIGDPVPGAVAAEFCAPISRLTRPNRPIDPMARGVHHIQDDEIAVYGIENTTAFMEIMGGSGSPKPDYFAAHNADFEQAFFKGGGIPWICTFKVALRVWPEAPNHKLQTLRYWLDLDIDQSLGLPAHRAGPDAYVNAALLARILEERKVPDLTTMVRWSKGPALLPRITFGNKFRDRPWEEADDGYLLWIVEKSDLDRDKKANAKHHLKLRGRL